MNWLQWLIDTNVFVTRNNCGPGWSDRLVAFYQLANFLIALAYFAIPISLVGLYIKVRSARKYINFNPWILLMFVTFIMMCGITHIFHVIVFWWPAYRLFAMFDMLTAVISLITAIILPVVLYDLFRSLPSNAVPTTRP